MSSAKLHPKTTNRKLAPVIVVDAPNTTRGKRPKAIGPFCASTYVSIQATCPDSCRFKGKGCYVTEGFTRKMSEKLDQSARDRRYTGEDVIREEAELIEGSFPGSNFYLPPDSSLGRPGGPVPSDGARGGRDLRLHVGGDVPSNWAAVRLARAAISWRRRGGGDVWTFTHRWREVFRSSWGRAISVLASVETVAEANQASLRGYAPSIVVSTFPSAKAFQLEGSPITWIPCPAETRGKTCVECRLCLDDDRLRRTGRGIAFALHGQGKGRVSLPVLKTRGKDHHG